MASRPRTNESYRWQTKIFTSNIAAGPGRASIISREQFHPFFARVSTDLDNLNEYSFFGMPRRHSQKKEKKEDSRIAKKTFLRRKENYDEKEGTEKRTLVES